MVLCRLWTYASLVCSHELDDETCLLLQNSQTECPTYPKFVKVNVEIDSVDWFDDDLPLIYGVMEMEIETSHATEIIMKMADNDYFFSFEAFNYPGRKAPLFNFAWKYDVNPNENNHILKSDYINVGAFYKVMATSKSGVIVGDTILINDYIDDPEIQRAISDYQRGYTAVEEVGVEEPEIQFIFRNDRIIVKDESNIIQKLVVYSMSGQTIFCQNGNGDIDVSSYFTGIYIIKYYTSRSKCGTFKFMKR